jgi:hypothetical protein
VYFSYNLFISIYLKKNLIRHSTTGVLHMSPAPLLKLRGKMKLNPSETRAGLATQAACSQPEDSKDFCFVCVHGPV